MGRRPCCDKVGLKKGPWTTEEDQKLLAYIQEHGHGSWSSLPPKAGLKRCGKSCRLRWTNYLRPDIKRGEFSLQEEQTIIQLHALLGNRWAAIASHLHKRTDNEIKNHWNTHLKKRLVKMGIDPVTHKPTSHALGGSCAQAKDMANLSHMAQWETARLEAEARIVRESVSSKLITHKNPNHDRQSESSLINKVRSMMIPRSQPRPPCLDVLKVWQSSWSTTNPRKNTSVSGVFTPNNTLESPTSVFNFSVISTLNTSLIDGLFHGNNSFATNYLINNHVRANNNDNYNYSQDGLKSLMDGSLMDAYNGDTIGFGSLGDSSMFPSFNMERFADLCEGINGVRSNNPDDLSVLCGGGVLEDDKISYWSNILDSEPSAIHSPVF